MWVPVQENDEGSRGRGMGSGSWEGAGIGGLGANKFLTNGEISTFSFTQRGEDLSLGLKVRWLASLVLQPQAFPFQTASPHAACHIFFLPSYSRGKCDVVALGGTDGSYAPSGVKSLT